MCLVHQGLHQQLAEASTPAFRRNDEAGELHLVLLGVEPEFTVRNQDTIGFVHHPRLDVGDLPPPQDL
jgi:hypothetical protein